MKIIKFKKPGDSITIGSQRFDQNNITPEIHKGLVEAFPHLADQFEEIEREFKIFLEEIVGNENLETFRQQYQNIHDTLKSTYE